MQPVGRSASVKCPTLIPSTAVKVSLSAAGFAYVDAFGSAGVAWPRPGVCAATATPNAQTAAVNGSIGLFRMARSKNLRTLEP